MGSLTNPTMVADVCRSFRSSPENYNYRIFWRERDSWISRPKTEQAGIRNPVRQSKRNTRPFFQRSKSRRQNSTVSPCSRNFARRRRRRRRPRFRHGPRRRREKPLHLHGKSPTNACMLEQSAQGIHEQPVAEVCRTSSLEGIIVFEAPSFDLY